jgi:hypothetical protein
VRCLRKIKRSVGNKQTRGLQIEREGAVTMIAGQRGNGKSREQKAESRGQRAESREQRAESREQRAESREQRAEDVLNSNTDVRENTSIIGGSMRKAL